MKTKQILKYIVFALAAGVVLESCKDNVVVPVANNKPVDSLKNLIAALNKTLVTVNKGDAAIKIQTAKYNSKKDSISQASSSYTQNVQYTVYIIDGSTSVIPCSSCRTSSSGKGDVSKMQGVDGATVVLSSGGNTYIATSADGRAIFNNVAVGGNATVTVTATGYTSITYTTVMFNTSYWTPSVISTNVSTSIMLLPTTGNNVATYTGQLYINKSVVDDTLGNVYNDVNDTKNYGNFVSAPGAYTGTNYSTSWLGSYYTQNAYGTPSGTQLKFDQATNFAGINVIYGYSYSVVDFYSNYGTITPGDPIEITINGLSAFATITATGSYTISVPTYANNPGIEFGISTDWNNSNYFQDSYTYLIGATTDTVAYSATKIVTSMTDKQLHNTNWSSYNTTSKSYAVNSSQKWYSVTRQYNFYPRWHNNSGGYTSPWGLTHIGLPGQTYYKDMYFFAYQPSGN